MCGLKLLCRLRVKVADSLVIKVLDCELNFCYTNSKLFSEVYTQLYLTIRGVLHSSILHSI